MALFSTNHRTPTLLACVSILAGLANLFVGVTPIFSIHSPMALTHYAAMTELIKVQQSSDFLSIIFGIILIVLGNGLYRQKYTAWVWTCIFSLLAFINATLPAPSWVGMAVSMLFFVLLVLNRRHFFRRSNSSARYQTLIASCSVIFALVYGSVGSYLLRAQFHGMMNWIDAIYFTIVTYSTVGYGGITPITENARIFTVTMILIGVGSFVTALSVLLGPMIQKNVKGVYKMVSHLSHLKGHIILCGDNVLTHECAKAYVDHAQKCFFLEPDKVTAQRLEDAGYNVIAVNPMNEKELATCNLNEATCFIAAYEEDAENILAVMSAATVCGKDRKTRLIARIEKSYNVQNAKQAGADEVISPLRVSAHTILAKL
ncbi:MAG: NAD-binding protein [Coxiellaceae bacterium]|nr:NAD-binding protein [Coxiellaceae bacterium]